jgi:hypothetical protein
MSVLTSRRRVCTTADYYADVRPASDRLVANGNGFLSFLTQSSITYRGAAASEEDCSMASETTTGSPMTVRSRSTTPFLAEAAAVARAVRRLVAH